MPIEFQTQGRRARLHDQLSGSAAAVAIVALSVAAWAWHSRQSIDPADVMLLYVGAEDCAPCRGWQKGERAAFLSSPEFGRVAYHEIKSPHLEDVLKDEYWPEDLRGYRQLLKRSDGVPLWLVVVNDKVVEHRFGAQEWRAVILPRIKSFVQ